MLARTAARPFPRLPEDIAPAAAEQRRQLRSAERCFEGAPPSPRCLKASTFRIQCPLRDRSRTIVETRRLSPFGAIRLKRRESESPRMPTSSMGADCVSSRTNRPHVGQMFRVAREQEGGTRIYRARRLARGLPYRLSTVDAGASRTGAPATQTSGKKTLGSAPASAPRTTHIALHFDGVAQAALARTLQRDRCRSPASTLRRRGARIELSSSAPCAPEAAPKPLRTRPSSQPAHFHVLRCDPAPPRLPGACPFFPPAQTAPDRSDATRGWSRP